MAFFLRSLVLAVVMAAAGSSWAQTTTSPAEPAAKPGLETAIFAGGCFWCTESDFDKVDGVVETISGYIGGTKANPTYHEVSTGTTGHAEAVKVTFDPAKVSYQKLVDYYWHTVDVLDSGGQFCDRGNQYRPEIFVLGDEQRRIAEASKAALDKSGRFKKPVVVRITPATTFTRAEEYHQDFYKKNPAHYQRYRIGCGRDARLEELWGKAKTQ